jgi:tetratricopeptide (TPR) repeat protein
MFFDLIDFLLERKVFGIADLALEYIVDKNTQRYLMAEAKVRVLQKRFVDATNSLKKLLATNDKDQQAWILRGHAFFFMNNLFDSEECYIKALRIKPAPDDPTLNIRLGIIYARRKSWKDAKTVFLKICKQSFSTQAWLYLGQSLLRLGELSAAEEAIAQANILDNTNPVVWGLLAILCLNFGKKRILQAKFALKEAYKYGLADAALIEEIGDLLDKEGFYEDA